MGKTTMKPVSVHLGGTGHLPAAERARLRKERSERRQEAALLAQNEALAAAKRRKEAVPDDGANRQEDPVCPHFFTPSNFEPEK